jgi:superfamily I DNA and/or RNA helicase
MLSCDSDSKAIKIAKEYKLSTKLKNSSGKTIMISFKSMELLIMESDGMKNKTVEKHKYNLGDVGIWKYCSAVKRYVSKGYISQGSVSNMDEIWKSHRKKQKAEEIKNADKSAEESDSM